MSSPAPRRRELVEELTRQIRHMGGVTILLHQAIADRVGVHTTDMQCLNILGTTGPVTAGRLAELTGLTTGAVTRLVDRLERAGFVVRRRDDRDRRQVFVEIVPERAAECGPLYESIGRSWQAHLTQYTDPELELILRFVTECAHMTRREVARSRLPDPADGPDG